MAIQGGRRHRTMTEAIRDFVARTGIRLAESSVIPDKVIRAGMRQVIASRLRQQSAADPMARARFREDSWGGPVALAGMESREQHYEVPPEFFELVLGSRLKYSSGFWSETVTHLDRAELAMLELYEERAGLKDGQSILDLGCGWGSFTLWAAERYPSSPLLAVSNSHSQAVRIKQLAADCGLPNVEVVTSDINDFVPGRRFDRVVSIEMLEHVRNHRALFERVAGWVEHDGAVFTHVFAHQLHEYPFETDGPANWMARTFFTGGLMPSRALIPDAGLPFFTKAAEWWIDGTHYARTLEAWLKRFDSNRNEVRQILEPVYGKEVDVWLQRWRMFFMACSEMFATDDGRQWGVAHQLLRPRPAG